jgi:putative DNA primase/helicase
VTGPSRVDELTAEAIATSAQAAPLATVGARRDHTETRHYEITHFQATRFVPPALGKEAERLGLKVGPGRSLWQYEGGVYRKEGNEWLASFVRAQLGDEFRANRLREVEAWCKANFEARLPVQPATEYINVSNGLLYWSEDPPRLVPHTPDVPSIIQIPVEWYPGADCPEFFSFLQSVLPERDQAQSMEFVLEWTGYLLTPSARFQRALMLEGPADTGKSTFLRVVEALLGEANVSHHSLQSICDDRFTAAYLYGMLANVCSDLEAKSIAHSGKFKQIVAGDRMTAERKFEHPFSYQPHARLIFSANEFPGTSDQSDAFYKRWLILPMDRKVAAECQDPDLVERLTTPAELAGLLKYSVAALRKLMRRRRFLVPPVMGEAVHRYRLMTDTVMAHMAERCVIEPEGRERSSTLYEDYGRWCQAKGRNALGKQRWKEQLGSQGSLEYKPRYAGYPTWAGIRLRSAADEQGETG